MTEHCPTCPHSAICLAEGPDKFRSRTIESHRIWKEHLTHHLSGMKEFLLVFTAMFIEAVDPLPCWRNVMEKPDGQREQCNRG